MNIMMTYNYCIFKNILYQRNELVDIRHNEKGKEKKNHCLKNELSIIALVIFLISECLCLSVISLAEASQESREYSSRFKLLVLDVEVEN